jgi:hypothetical protein
LAAAVRILSRLIFVLLVGAAASGQSGELPADGARRAALQQAAAATVPASGGAPAAQGPLRLVDLSLSVLAAAGASTERDDVLRDLKGGSHDPRKRGFTLQQAELSLAGAVDPWFDARAHISAALDPEDGESIVELEEAYLTTRQLPSGMQLKAGTFLTEFGRINPQHPHLWDWQDQPVMHSRVFGGDGMRGPGARLSWLLPTSAQIEWSVGVQNANGETMTSFLASDEVYEERAIGGRQFVAREVRSLGDLVCTSRLAAAFDLDAATTLGLGASIACGPNATGDGGDTILYGVDFALRWRPADHRRGFPFWKLQGELLARAFDAAEQVDDADPLSPVPLPGRTLDDVGGYLQALRGFGDGWAVGVRCDYATGSGASYLGGGAFDRAQDPFRCDRLRLSPLVLWQVSEFSRLRLQYDFDDSDHLDKEAHSLWLGVEVLIGTHPAHPF